MEHFIFQDSIHSIYSSSMNCGEIIAQNRGCRYCGGFSGICRKLP
jgi:hypothetical protein